jgi:predicted kinase
LANQDSFVRVEAVIFIGIQGSGKSQFYREKFFNSHVRISLDLLKTRPRELKFLEACLETGQPFVVDNTNPTVEDRKRYILPARGRGYRVVGYFFEPDIALALKRNEARLPGERVPKPGLFATNKRLQRPTFAEGFDELYRIRAVEGPFVLEIWHEENTPARDIESCGVGPR